MPSPSKSQMRADIRPIQDKLAWLWKDLWITIRSTICHCDWLARVDVSTVHRHRAMCWVDSARKAAIWYVEPDELFDCSRDQRRVSPELGLECLVGGEMIRYVAKENRRSDHADDEGLTEGATKYRIRVSSMTSLYNPTISWTDSTYINFSLSSSLPSASLSSNKLLAGSSSPSLISLFRSANKSLAISYNFVL